MSRELTIEFIDAHFIRPLRVCAGERRRFPVGVSPTRQPLQPEATGAVMEVTKWLKPLVSVSRYTVTARVCRQKRARTRRKPRKGRCAGRPDNPFGEG